MKLNKAFTLIELVVSIAVTSILLVFAFSSYYFISISLNSTNNKTNSLNEAILFKEDLFSYLDLIKENNLDKFDYEFNLISESEFNLESDENPLYNFNFNAQEVSLKITDSVSNLIIETWKYSILDVSFSINETYKDVLILNIDYSIDLFICSYKMK